MAQNVEPRTRRGGAGTGFGVVLVVFGILALLDQVFGVNIWSTAWPFGIVAIGLAFFVPMLIGGKSMAGLAIPGSIITTIGLILAYQNSFNRYETWSYAWALIVVSVGVGILIQGFWTNDPKTFQAGIRVAGIGAVLFVVFGAFFEVVVGFAGVEAASAGRWFWPVMLIVLGVVLLLSRGRRRGAG